MYRFKKIIPNMLSGSRLLLSLIFPFSTEWLQLWLVVAAGVSDLADGWLARKWNSMTWIGGMVDAIADKVFVLTVLTVFVADDRFSPIWIPVVLSRDLTVVLTAGYAGACGRWDALRRMKVRVMGKMATGGQFLLFVTVLLLPEMSVYGLVIASLCSGCAALDYGWHFFRELLGVSGEDTVRRR